MFFYQRILQLKNMTKPTDTKINRHVFLEVLTAICYSTVQYGSIAYFIREHTDRYEHTHTQTKCLATHKQAHSLIEIVKPSSKALGQRNGFLQHYSLYVYYSQIKKFFLSTLPSSSLNHSKAPHSSSQCLTGMTMRIIGREQECVFVCCVFIYHLYADQSVLLELNYYVDYVTSLALNQPRWDPFQLFHASENEELTHDKQWHRKIAF